MASDLDSLFVEANTLYQNEQYADAIVIYDSILKSESHSFEVYFNLGNSYYNHGNMSKSILNYEKALKVEPHNSNCIANQKIAEERITKVESIPVLFLQKWRNQISQSMSLSFWVSILVLIIWINCTLLYYFLKNRRKTTFNSLIISLLITVFLASIYYNSNQINQQEFAVLMQDSEFYSSESSSKLLFEVTLGNKVEILSRNNQWLFVRLADGRTAYIEAKNLDII